MKRRERLGVIYDILLIIKQHHNSIKPTPLLRYSNLSSRSFADYYQELLLKEFIKELFDERGKKYVTLSDKGFEYIDKYSLITDFIEEFEL
jgi:predicted transcriptional regulator